MGEVYRARDTRLGRLVAIKFVAADSEDSPDAEARLAREARLASSLNHPGIVTVFDIGSYEGRTYVVMEWIEGIPLSSRISSGPLSIREAADVAWQVADALATAHESGIVHRDLKPQNIMLMSNGRTKVVDFGLSRPCTRSPQDVTATFVTQGMAVIGTPGYIAPEQIRAEAAEPQADQFALGVILYELLTNLRAFKKDTSVETLSAILVEDPPPLEMRRPDVPPMLRSIVRRCLNKKAAERYASTRDLARDLSEVLETCVVETRSSPEDRVALRLTGYAILAAVLIIVASIGLWSGRWSSAPVPAAVPASQSVKHIVVMPFTNVTKDADDQVFADGLVETLTSSLSSLERFHHPLRVVPASEVRGRVATVKDAHQAFGATLAITGSIQRLPDTTRLTLNLVDAANLLQLASRTLDLGSTREALTQDACINSLTGMLDLQLEPVAHRALTAGGTSLPAAYELFVQGRGFLQRFDRGIANIDRAIDALTRAVAADPAYVLAESALGEAYWRKYEADKATVWIEKATQHGERALAIDNRVASVYVTQAIVARARGRYEDAVTAARRAIELDSVASEGYHELARAYEALNKFDDAEATYRRAIAARTDDWLPYHTLGAFYLGRARWADAEVVLKKVIELTPDNTRAYNNLGIAYFQLGRADDAVAIWERSLRIRPTTAAASNLGTHFFTTGRYADAARAFERAVELSPNDRRVWRNLGAARYWAPGERETAAPAFERAVALAEAELKVNARQPLVFAELADSYSILGFRKQAIDAAQAFETSGSSDAAAQYTVAQAYEQLGDRTKALHWLERSISSGYSPQTIERSPGLKALREDPRYQRLRK